MTRAHSDTGTTGREQARKLAALVAAVLSGRALDPGQAVARAEASAVPTAVLAVGKAAAPMMIAARQRFGRGLPGLCVAPDPRGLGDRNLTRLRGDHPFPGPASRRAGRRVRGFVGALRSDDHLLVLLSGGASALAEVPAHGLSLGHYRDLIERLWAVGADICDINLVRRHLSRIKGGRLAAIAAPAQVTVWLLSDVVETRGDDLIAEIGSGPFRVDHSSLRDVRALLARHQLLDHPAAVRLDESVKRGPSAVHQILLDNAAARRAVAAEACASGWESHVLSEPQTGDPELIAGALVSAASALPAGSLLVAGGEATPTLPPDAPPGGRSQHLALVCAQTLATRGVAATVLCCGTDGRDGPTDAMGAWADEHTPERLRAVGCDLDAIVRARGAHRALAQLGQLLPSRDTGHNLADLYLVLRR